MVSVSDSIIVFFEDPFWVGIFERRNGTSLETARVVFGAEPKDYEVYDFFLKNYARLLFSPPVKLGKAPPKKINSKRARKNAARALGSAGIGTKSQQALKLLQENTLAAKKQKRRRITEEEAEKKLLLKRQKHKEKHKGR